MKKHLRWTVMIMALACLLSLVGCKIKDRFVVDGPDMERKLWNEFTISRCSERFEPIYSYTVKHDDGSAYLFEGDIEGGGILLSEKTTSSLFNLNILSLPEEEPLDGTFLGLSVTNEKGEICHKKISAALEEEILELLLPYIDEADDEEEEPFMLDGPDMEYTPPWKEFTLSRSDSSTQYSFWFTVTDGELDTVVTGQCSDKDGRSYSSETGIVIPIETLRALQWLDLEQLSEYEPWPEDLEKPLDDYEIRLSVTLADGTVLNKQASRELSMEIYELLLPYFINN